MSRRSVSVIIPTRNPGARFEELLTALGGAGDSGGGSDPSIEVIVVDSASGDGTAERALRVGATVVPVDPEAFDHGGTRNMGARHAHGDVLVFLTQDARPVSDRFIDVLTRGLGGAGEPDAAYARQIAGEGADPIEEFSRSFNYPETPALRTESDIQTSGLRACFFSNTASAIPRGTFEALGGFREPILTNEDMEFAYRLLRGGGRIAYRPEAVVLHRHDMSLFRRFRRYFDIGAFFAAEPELGRIGKGGEGMRFVLKETATLIRTGRPQWIPFALCDAGVRYLGMVCGRMASVMPRRLVRRCSGHPGFWR